MFSKNKKIFVLFFVFMLMFLASCGKKDIIFKLEENDIELNVGDTYVPKITVENIENYQLEYQYDEDLIKIENDEIICLSYGTCEIYISIINCDEVEPLVLYLNIYELIPTKIECEKEIKMHIGDELQVMPKVEPESTIWTFNYSSNNKNIVSVNNAGVIKALSEGETYVVVTLEKYSNLRTRILVIVEKPPVESIESEKTIKLTYNQIYQLTWDVLPSSADNRVMFESSNPDVASVNEKGIVSSHAFGQTTIKIISCVDESKYVEVLVYVDGDKTQNIVVKEDHIDLQLGETHELTYLIVPSTACQKINIVIDGGDGISIDGNKILAEKVGEYKVLLSTIDETNIEKIISVSVTGEENPIFVTNQKFEDQAVITWNEEFSPLDNIFALDNKDGNITDKIVVKGEVDNRRYGEYILEYSIVDSDGNVQTLERTVKVTWGYDVTVIGHAGSYYGVPNSEEAILYAAEILKYPAIEIDLKQTKDGVFVLSHDPKWGDAVLEETNYEELKNVEYTVVKTAGIVEGNLTEKERTFTAKICTFERYLEICKQYNIIAVVELKTSSGISNWTEANAPHLSKMSKIMDLIKKYEMENRVVFLSSQELCLNWVKTNGYENIPCQYLTLSSCENEKTYNIVKQYKLDISFNVRDGIKISDEWLNKYRDLGCKLAVFTFEEWASYEDIQTWIDRGVDYVTTDWHALDKLNLN